MCDSFRVTTVVQMRQGNLCCPSLLCCQNTIGEEHISDCKTGSCITRQGLTHAALGTTLIHKLHWHTYVIHHALQALAFVLLQLTWLQRVQLACMRMHNQNSGIDVHASLVWFSAAPVLLMSAAYPETFSRFFMSGGIFSVASISFGMDSSQSSHVC